MSKRKKPDTDDDAIQDTDDEIGQIERMRKLVNDAKSDPDGSAVRERTTIRLKPHDYAENLDKIEQALLDFGMDVYQRGGMLVGIGTVKALGSDHRMHGYQTIVELDAIALREYVARCCRFEKYARPNSKSLDQTLPPEYLTRWAGATPQVLLRVLKATISHPYLFDGELIVKPGYDPRTGVYYDPLGVKFPDMLEITPENALAVANEALERIRRLYHTFPFTNEAGRSAAISLLLSSVNRRSLMTIPMHVGDASKPRSGKGKIAAIAGIVESGKPMSVINHGGSQTEFQKRLDTRLLGGHPMIVVDNCSTVIEGDTLCSITVEETVAIRLFGRLHDVDVAGGVLIRVNGNNILIKGDAVTRSVAYRLDPKALRPELLVFDYDPLADAKDHRPELVIAALTVVKAYQVALGATGEAWKVAGCPKCPPPWQGFDDWSRNIRGALIWLGMPDPCETTEALREADPGVAEMRMIYQLCQPAVGDTRFTSDDLKQIADKLIPKVDDKGEPRKDINGQPELRYANPELRQALLRLAVDDDHRTVGDDRCINPIVLGRWFQLRFGTMITLGDQTMKVVQAGPRGHANPSSWPSRISRARRTLTRRRARTTTTIAFRSKRSAHHVRRLRSRHTRRWFRLIA